MLLEGETVMNIGSDFFKLQKIKQASFFLRHSVVTTRCCHTISPCQSDSISKTVLHAGSEIKKWAQSTFWRDVLEGS